jgi:pimeloyl-ACP methyl ester carboxylesterase
MRNRTILTAIGILPIVITLLQPARSIFSQANERQQVVTNGKASIHVTIRGRGAPVVFVPSLGRSVHDFDDLSERMVRSGYQAVLPEPRGIGGSVGPLDGITLHDEAADKAAVIRTIAAGPVILVGHAYGNRVTRMVATDYPRLVKQIVLIASGGEVPMSDKTLVIFDRVFNPGLDKAERLDAIGAIFFAKGHDPKVWQDGWYFDVAKAQQGASRATPVKEWSAGGTAPMLILQGTEDIIALPENSANLAKQYPDRVRVIQIARAGHAMLPEQPDDIASAILKGLK